MYMYQVQRMHCVEKFVCVGKKVIQKFQLKFVFGSQKLGCLFLYNKINDFTEKNSNQMFNLFRLKTISVQNVLNKCGMRVTE